MPDWSDSFALFVQLSAWGMSLGFVFHTIGFCTGRASGLIIDLMKGKAS
ncbi:MAG: hypothetical protein Tsb0013_02570 [Phycisphaerales bacterium]